MYSTKVNALKLLWHQNQCISNFVKIVIPCSVRDTHHYRRASTSGRPMNTEVREATFEDRDKVLSIILDYKDDYLPDKYISLLGMPNYYGYVCEVDGQVIGFAGVSIVDGGHTGVMRSGRVVKELRGKGMTTDMLSYILMKHPRLKNVVYYTSANMKRLLQKPTHSLITNVKFTQYKGNRRLLNITKGKTVTPFVSVVSESVLKDLFIKLTRYQKVFECQRFVVDSVPYKPITNNIQSILKTGNGFISFQNEPMKTLVTFGSHFRLPSGEILCVIFVHGTVNEYFTHHIAAHIQVFCYEIREDTNIIIEIDSIHTEDHIVFEDVVCSLGLRPEFSGQYNQNEGIIFQVQLQEPSLKL